MRTHLILLLLPFIASCAVDTDTTEVRRLHARITHLEQRVDSLLTIPGHPVFKADRVNRDNNTSYRSSQNTFRCQATTKKGTQCKRNSRSGGYCWQHGG